jgi:hypothetical protein
MFFLGITILFLLVLYAVGSAVFFYQPEVNSVEEQAYFIKPKIKIDFSVLDLQQVTGSTLMGRVQKEFVYSGQTEQGEQETGSVFAATKDEAQNNLKDMGLTMITLEEIAVGRENPFEPYYVIDVNSK